MSRSDLQNNLYLGNRINEPVALSPAARARHVYIVGRTGTGKSTLLLNLLAQDLATGRGIALLDPHGDLAEAAVGLLPRRRGDDLVYFDPSDLAHPIGFNLLARLPEDHRPLVADGVVGAFRAIWPDFWGPRLEHIFAHAVRSLMDVPNATLLYLPRLLQDEAFRAQCIAHVTDPVVRAFWMHEYAAYPPRFREEAIAPVLNKIGRVLMTPAIRNIIAQPKTTIDLRFMMDDNRILIANLSKGALGEGPAHLLGALLITALAQAALSRRDLAEADRKPFHIYADEFQSFATTSFGLILSEARKYGLTLTLAHQYLAQLPDDLRDAVFGNVGSLLAFRVGAQDAPILARQLDIANEAALKEQSNYKALGSILLNGVPSRAFQLECFEPPEALHMRAHRLMAHSRLRFGRDRHIIDAHIARFYTEKN
jgi:type IV secretory pathway TraG/TraD family ATPase VirD4